MNKKNNVRVKLAMIGTIAMIVIVLMIIGIRTVLVEHQYKSPHVYPVRIDDTVAVRDMNKYSTTWDGARVIKIDGKNIEEDETVWILVS